jgi:uncharacterized membrane protein
MSAAEVMPFGPVQMLVLEFDRTRFDGEIMPELERLKDDGVIRLIDLLFVTKTEDGELDVIQTSDLSKDEATEFGALIGALVGLGMGSEEETVRAAEAGAAELEDGHIFDETEVWYLADAIPAGSSAAVALIEHRWAIPLRDKIVQAGGIALADEWIHPADLIAVGAAAAGSVAGAEKAAV